MSVWYSDLNLITPLQIANSPECTLEMEARPHCFLLSQHKWSSLKSSRWAQNWNCLEIKQSRPKSPSQGRPLSRGMWKAPPVRGDVAPLCFGLYQLADEALCSAGQTKMVLRRPQYCLEKERTHLPILPWCWAGTACCFSSWAHRGLAPDRSERFPETNAFERYFPSPPTGNSCV
jgi:hypothetical protein